MNKNKTMSKTCQRIYQYMALHNGITQAEAFLELGVGRLPARISDIKAVGVPISRQMIKVTKKDGSNAWVARYSIYRGEGIAE